MSKEFGPAEGEVLYNVESLIPGASQNKFGTRGAENIEEQVAIIADAQRRLAEADPTRIHAYVIAVVTDLGEGAGKGATVKVNCELAGSEELKIHLVNSIIVSLTRQLGMNDDEGDD